MRSEELVARDDESEVSRAEIDGRRAVLGAEWGTMPVKWAEIGVPQWRSGSLRRLRPEGAGAICPRKCPSPPRLVRYSMYEVTPTRTTFHPAPDRASTRSSEYMDHPPGPIGDPTTRTYAESAWEG